MAAKTSEWRPGPSVCRCCLTEGCYKDISTEYFWMGKREVYEEMLSDTLSINIAFSQSGGPNSNSRLICEPCISRLRDATDFRRQVLECERTFMQHLDPASSSLNVEDSGSAVDADVKLEAVKQEATVSDEDFDDHCDFLEDDDDLDEVPLTKLASKVPKKESVDLLDLLDNSQVTVKRKSTTKAKASPSKKVKITKEQKPSSSKVVNVKPEKKKKGESESANTDSVGRKQPPSSRYKELQINLQESITIRRKKAATLIKNSKIIPFRWMRSLFICFYCEDGFEDIAKLREHSATEHTKLTTEEISKAICRLRKHELIKADITDVACKICPDNITDLNSLILHFCEKHSYLGIDRSIANVILPFKFTQKEFKCAMCDDKFNVYKTLNHHMNLHFPNYICDSCGAGFITPARLRGHAFSHETGSFTCDACNKVFRSANSKNQHYARVHLRVTRHRCPHCPEAFGNYYQRNKHVSSVHGVKLKEFKCTMCPRVYTLSGKLTVHMNTVHLKIKRHACKICDKKFYSNSILKKHMIRHGGERKYHCNICKKAYPRNRTLRNHMRIHNNDKRYVCNICGIGYVQNCSLKHHIKKHHKSYGDTKTEDNLQSNYD